MKKKIVILGSTGSIGQTLFKFIKKNKKRFKVLLLTTNKNYKKLIKQANELKVNKLIIKDKEIFQFVKNNPKYKNFNIYNNFTIFDKIFKSKIDYVMSSISGIEGLEPTIDIIKHTKKIAIANKESIICGWSIIKNELNKHQTEFIPVDSEHFSIWFALKNLSLNDISKIYLTASGGPFLNFSLKKLKNVNIKQALKHPNWSMGKKISIDSATLMNKVFEVIEAKHIFNIPYKKLKIIIHPNSYIHAIIKLNNGLFKIIAHDTTMKIPIINTIIDDFRYKHKTPKKTFLKFNDLKFYNVNQKKFPLVKLINMLPDNNSLFETILVTLNDALVNLFLTKKIKFLDISKIILNYTSNKKLLIYKNIKPYNLSKIIDTNNLINTIIMKQYS